MVPPNAPADVVLLFDRKAAGNTIPVYLCNAGSVPLTEVVVTGGSMAVDPLSPTWTDKPADGDFTLPSGTGALINEHRPMWDGDDLVFYSIQFTDPAGTRHLVQASLIKEAFPPQWVKLRPAKASNGV